jgi:Fic family protein
MGPVCPPAGRRRTALANGYRTLKKRPLSTATAIEICRTIKNVNLDIRRVPGTKLANDRTQEVIYTPPEGEARLREKLANWERFLNESEQLDPLIRMAVGHYQFEAMHPFTAGNGRTGRILNILYMVEQELLDIPVLYLSRYIIRNKPGYYGLLMEVTRKASWENWVLYMLEGVAQTAAWTADKIRATRKLIEDTVGYVRRQEPSLYTHELVEQLFVQPYCRIGNLVKAGVGHRETVSKYLKALCAIGVLEEQKVGREKLFVNPRFLKLLTGESNKYAPFKDHAKQDRIE